MDYELELKPITAQAGEKYKVIQITDFTFHTAYKQITKSPGQKIQEAFISGNPGRIYSPINNEDQSKQVGFLNVIKNDSKFMAMIREERAKGYKVVFDLSKSGILFYPGKDTEEFIQSKNGKRILRGIEKAQS